MNILEFVEKFKDELTCKAYLRDIRLKEGVTCKHCGGKKHYWLAAKWQFQCSSCSFRTTLRSGTAVSYTHLRAHETRHDLVCRLLLEKKKKKNKHYILIL